MCGTGEVEPHTHGSGGLRDRRMCSHHCHTRSEIADRQPVVCGEVGPLRSKLPGNLRFPGSQRHRPRHSPAGPCSSCRTECRRTSNPQRTTVVPRQMIRTLRSLFSQAWSRPIKSRARFMRILRLAKNRFSLFVSNTFGKISSAHKIIFRSSCRYNRSDRRIKTLSRTSGDVCRSEMVFGPRCSRTWKHGHNFARR